MGGRRWLRWTVLPAIAGALTAALAGQIATADEALCFGKRPTKVGTAGADNIQSEPDVHDVIMGLGGKDHLSGGTGDRICGGDGHDIVSGARFLSGDNGNDYMVGSRRPNLFIGGHGRDRADLLGGGKDLVRGGSGSDRVDAPTPRGNVGGEAVIHLAKGYVTTVLTEKTKIYSIERAVICDWEVNVVMYGTAERNRLLALCAGEAIIYGRGGDDELWGWDNDDRLYGGPGNDLLRARGGDGDYVNGGSGTDICNGGETVVACE